MTTPATLTRPAALGRVEVMPDRTVVRVNRIRYPKPNRLGLKRSN